MMIVFLWIPFCISSYLSLSVLKKAYFSSLYSLKKKVYPFDIIGLGNSLVFNRWLFAKCVVLLDRVINFIGKFPLFSGTLWIVLFVPNFYQIILALLRIIPAWVICFVLIFCLHRLFRTADLHTILRIAGLCRWNRRYLVVETFLY